MDLRARSYWMITRVDKIKQDDKKILEEVFVIASISTVVQHEKNNKELSGRTNSWCGLDTGLGKNKVRRRAEAASCSLKLIGDDFVSSQQSQRILLLRFVCL